MSNDNLSIYTGHQYRVYLQGYNVIEIDTVPSESIDTPWVFPNFVALQPEFTFVQLFYKLKCDMSWVNKYSTRLLWEA
jgi:hypothetical protein